MLPLDEPLKIYDYPGRWTSRCWKYFGFYKKKAGPPSKDTLDMKIAVCKLCKKSYANNANTSNFLAHIDTFHPLESSQPTEASREQGPRQQKLSFQKPEMVVGKVLPCSLVDNPFFKSFAKALDPKYEPPSRTTLMRSLQRKKEDMSKKLMTDIQKSETVSITHDGWTSLNTESFNTTTVHLINNEWELKTMVLDTKKMEGSHTSEHIADTLRETKRKWKLPSIMATTDNAANERKAFQLLGWDRFGCYGHRINLTVRNALEVEEVSKLTAKARKLVTFFHSSSSGADQLKKKQQLLFPPPSPKASHNLINDVVTRWNSTNEMLKRVVELMPAIVALANDDISKDASSTIRKNAFSFDELTLAQNIVAVLSDFQKATDILCAENSPTMHKVLPVIVKLTRATEISDADLPSIKALKLKLKSELEKRTVCEDISLAACVLNPYTKDFHFLPQKRDEAHALLRHLASETELRAPIKKEDEINNSVENPDDYAPNLPSLPTAANLLLPAVNDDKSEESPAKKPKLMCADMEDWLEDVVCTGESHIDPQTMVEKELSTYFLSKVPANMTMLQWWKEHESIYPRLSKLVKKYLSCPASSVPSERVFSLAGNLVNKKRCRLSPDNVDMFIFLNKNLKEYW